MCFLERRKKGGGCSGENKGVRDMGSLERKKERKVGGL